MNRAAAEGSEGCILALDVGTSSIHCLLADSLGRPIATASGPIIYSTSNGGSLLAREFDPEAVLDTLGRLIRELLNREGMGTRYISAIGLTSQRQGVVFLDDAGKEIYCGPNLDLRAVFEGAAIDEELAGEIYATTGHFPSLLLAPARLRWFRENRPSVYHDTCAVLTIAGWLAYRLAGSLIAEPSLDAEAGLLDIRSRERCPALMEALGVPLSLLPPLLRGCTPAGHLTYPMTTRWGLRDGLPVVIAGPDTQCGLLGMGLTKVGQVGAVMGWSGALQAITARPCYDEGMRTWVGCYPFDFAEDSSFGPAAGESADGLWVAESNLGDAGNAYRWLKDTLLGTNASFEEAEQLAQQASAASEGVVAFLGPGPVSSMRAGLRMGGMFFPTPLSFQETTREQLLCAGLENIAFSIKANLSTLQDVTGLETQTLYLGGGMASSRALATKLASVLGFPVRRSKMPQVSARGAAIVAAVYTDSSLVLEQVMEAASNDCEDVEPGTASDVAQSQEHYCQWLQLYKRLEWE